MCHPGRPGPISLSQKPRPASAPSTRQNPGRCLSRIHRHRRGRRLPFLRNLFWKACRSRGTWQFGSSKILLGAVGESLLHQLCNRLGHFRDVLRSAHQFRLFDIQDAGVVQQRLVVLSGVLGYADSSAGGIADYLVIHVGQVHYVADFITTVTQETMQNVDRDEGTKVADVAIVVNGRPAAYMRTRFP